MDKADIKDRGPPALERSRPRRVSLRHQCLVAAGLLAAIAASRLPTLFLHAVDWDESLYFLMAEQWHAGHLPYTVIFDNKPIGIYAIFYLLQSVFGDHVLAIRLGAVVFLAITAWVIFEIILRLPAFDGRLSMIAGLGGAFAFVIGAVSNGGLAANTEIFMTSFTSAAVLCLVCPAVLKQRPFWRGLVIGLLIGSAFMIKYVVVFEFFAYAYALWRLGPAYKPAQIFRLFCGAACGGALPLVVTMAWYAHAGQWGVWLDASLLSNLRREDTVITPLNFALAMKFIKWLPLFLSPALLLVPAWEKPHFVLSERRDFGHGFHIFLILWLLGCAAGVTAGKSFYSHYFIEILPALCVALGWNVLRFLSFLQGWTVLRLGFGFLAVMLVPILSAGGAFYNATSPLLTLGGEKIRFHADISGQIAQEIGPQGGKNTVYVFDYEPIIYSLVGATLPTRFVYPPFLTTCFLARVAQVDDVAEVTRILAGTPEFTVQARVPISGLATDAAVYRVFNADMQARYVVWRRYADATLYRLRAGAPGFVTSAAATPGRCAR